MNQLSTKKLDSQCVFVIVNKLFDFQSGKNIKRKPIFIRSANKETMNEIYSVLSVHFSIDFS